MSEDPDVPVITLELADTVSDLMKAYVEAHCPYVENKADRDRAIAREVLLALMWGSRGNGLNKLWLIEGIGEAVGLVVNSQDGPMQAVILEHYGQGVALSNAPATRAAKRQLQ